MLMLESILFIQKLSISDWVNLYRDLPSVQTKCKYIFMLIQKTVKVKDRRKIKVSKDETRVLDPQDLQKQLDQLMQKYKGSRTFIRPSGTEDVVRVYAEAETQEAAQQLADDVC